MKFHLNKANVNNIDCIMNVEAECFAPFIQEKRDTFLNRLNSDNNPFYIFYDEELNYTGYICAEYIEEIPATADKIKLDHNPMNKKTDCLYISSFAVKPEYQGKGNGSLLWNLSINEFLKDKEIKKIILLVNENWKAARHIYEKSGFEKINEFKEFFQDGNGILMKKIIY